ncbi:hypothetical protein BJP40_13240 [Streptomyces sp. CC53]|uniref:hypothetical protein n=1 Tax=Streptomyces sp. CC53 TaxID=1906740 RepID=UPI0008DD17F7|nr:hypothetical protein [Streptomyces sp. CC53]OII59576.1 hypothetical protein BJP40_13240 [Streptomyces sp. CC53]
MSIRAHLTAATAPSRTESGSRVPATVAHGETARLASTDHKAPDPTPPTAGTGTGELWREVVTGNSHPRPALHDAPAHDRRHLLRATPGATPARRPVTSPTPSRATTSYPQASTPTPSSRHSD